MRIRVALLHAEEDYSTCVRERARGVQQRSYQRLGEHDVRADDACADAAADAAADSDAVD